MDQDRRFQKRVIVYRAEIPGQTGRYEVVYESVADALHFACRDLATERRRPLAIVEDGLILYDADQIAAECEARVREGGVTDSDRDDKSNRKALEP